MKADIFLSRSSVITLTQSEGCVEGRGRSGGELHFDTS